MSAARLSAVLLVIVACASIALAGPVSYTFIDLSPTSATFSQANELSGANQVGSVNISGGTGRAALWMGTAQSFIDLTPSGFTISDAQGISGAQQVGAVQKDAQSPTHAALWSGSAASFVELHPSGAISSSAHATSGSQQAGVVDGKAYIWAGTAASGQNITPAGATGAELWDTNGSQQVGVVSDPSTHLPHAGLWSGSSNTFVDLHPATGFDYSQANAIGDGQQGGYGHTDLLSTGEDTRHALLWSGTAESVVDLHPKSSFLESEINDVAGGLQVGDGQQFAFLGGNIHALLWSGTADSVIDLHSFLSSDYLFSTAQAIDANGNIVGSAGLADTGEIHAVMWVPSAAAATPLPPGALAGLPGLLILAVAARRSRHAI